MTLSRYDYNNGSIIDYYSEATVLDYQKKCAELLKDGFVLYDTLTIRDNYHSTYIKNDCIVQIYFNEDINELRIVTDRNNTLPLREPDIDERIGGSTVIYQLELDFRNVDCGMCYIVKCPDNSFFIVDSAHQNSVDDHRRIYQFLREHTPADEKIVIAGWFLSHAHQDHIVKFMDFVRDAHEDVVIERMYYNFPQADDELSSEFWKEDDKVTMREFEALMANHTELVTTRLHTGQKFYVRNLEFTVLCTHEDLYPAPSKRFNDTSTVLMMKVEGQNIFWPGDACEVESEILMARYGHKLKAKIIQFAHHGFRGIIPELYKMLGGEVLLVSTDQKHYVDNLERPANKMAYSIAKEVYVAGNGTVALELPYVDGSAVVSSQVINNK